MMNRIITVTLNRITPHLTSAMNKPGLLLAQEERKVPPAEKQDHGHEADVDHVHVFPEEEHAELHAGILGMKSADQLLLRLGQVKRKPVGLGERTDQENQEPDR